MEGGFLENTVFRIGFLEIHGSIVISWIVLAILILIAFFSGRRLELTPGRYQTLVEGIITAARNAIGEVLPDQIELVFPFVTTLWGFILMANLIGLVPGLSSPTADLSVTASLAVLVYFSVHWFGIRVEGWGGYLKHYLTPSPLLLPFHLISEVSRTLALAVRLFGNIMSLEIASLLVLMIAGFLVPVPLLLLHIVEAVIQAYIFGMLALVYIAGGIETQESRRMNGEMT